MLTPQDIENKMFKVSFKGYNVVEVDDFLQEVCDSYVELYDEVEKFKKHNGMLSEAVGQYKSMEDTLNNALNVADLSTDEIEQEAQKKAELIIKNAEQMADDIIAGAKQRVELEVESFNEIQKKMDTYKDRVRDLLDAQMKILGGYATVAAERTAAAEPKAESEAKTEAEPDVQESELHEMKTENLPVIKD